MFKIKVIALGKFKEKAFLELEQEYLKRMKPYAKINVNELAEIPYHKNEDVERVKEKEAEKIIKQLPKDGLVILLEEKGTLRNSVDFAQFLHRTGSLGK